MKRYETYKDSGIQWWEEIPTHWDLKKAKHIFSLVTENVSDSSLPKIALENIESWTGKYIETDSDFMGEGVEFKKDDILFGKLRPYLAKVYKAEFAGQAVGDMYVFRGNEEQNPEYLKYLLLSYPFISVVDGSTYGAKMPRANWDFISHLVLPCPPKTEQVTIAAFLDHMVGKIDATIAEKEQMLEDLKNYRSAIISEAVTKGLDKNVEMKNSGIEWMGEIPSHWDIVKTSYLFDDIGSGTTPNTNDDSLYDADNGINWLQTGDLNDGHITKTSKKISQKAIEGNSTLRLYPVNSLVIALYGATIGKVGVLDIETTTNQACCVLPPSDKVLTDYAYYVFIASKKALLNLASGGGQPNISQAIIKNHRIPYPSYVEQQAITTYLDNKVEQIDKTLLELESQIHELKSYKSALITEAVTGKIDLREWKPPKENV